MEVIKGLFEHEDALLIVGAFILFWLFWLPKVIAPIVARHYANLPNSVRGIISAFLPTLEDAVRTVWLNTYMTIQLGTEQTQDTADDEVWARVNEIVLDRIDEIDGEDDPAF